MTTDMELNIDLAISLDTSLSMYVMRFLSIERITELIHDFLYAGSNTRIAVIGHQDYSHHDYITTVHDFTDNKEELLTFLKTLSFTGGGDAKECYEVALKDARNLSWRPDSTKALLVIGDSGPHEKDEPENKSKIDWKEELQLLKESKVTIFSAQCGGWPYVNNLGPYAEKVHVTYENPFMDTMAAETGGRVVRMRDFPDLHAWIRRTVTNEAEPPKREPQKTYAQSMAEVNEWLNSAPKFDFTSAADYFKSPQAINVFGPPPEETTSTSFATVDAEMSPVNIEWSNWKLAGAPGKDTQGGWTPFSTGSLKTLSDDSQGLCLYQLGVQTSPGAKKRPVFVSKPHKGPVNIAELLEGHGSALGQLKRVLSLGMTVHVRTAAASGGNELLDVKKFAWNSGKSLRMKDGVYISVQEKSLKDKY